MKTIAMPLGLLALAGSIVPPILFMLGLLGQEPMKQLMLASTVVWFVTAPMWMKSE